MAEVKNLKWRNRYSGETGYVKSVSLAKGYFINTFDKSEAKQYRSDKMISNDLDILLKIGEMDNNDFLTEE